MDYVLRNCGCSSASPDFFLHGQMVQAGSSPCSLFISWWQARPTMIINMLIMALDIQAFIELSVNQACGISFNPYDHPLN